MERELHRAAVNRFFGKFSTKTWLDLKLVRQGSFRLDENTITQNLVRDFWIESQMTKFPLTVYEAKNEPVNGNDLEIFVETNHGYILIPTQVKVIKHDDRYKEITHAVRGVPQIDLLIDYARKKGGIPAYFFYNFFSVYDFELYLEETFENISPHEFGCTTGNAYDIRNYFYHRGGLNKWHIPSFDELHLPVRFAIPLHWAFRRLVGGSKDDVAFFKGKKNAAEKVHFYSLDDLQNDDYWSELFPPGKISGLSDLPLMGDPYEKIVAHASPPNTKRHSSREPHLFNPAFRVVIHQNKRENRRSYLS